MLLVLAGIVAWIFFEVLARRPGGTTIADDARERGA
jgi:hypothetical protein